MRVKNISLRKTLLSSAMNKELRTAAFIDDLAPSLQMEHSPLKVYIAVQNAEYLACT